MHKLTRHVEENPKAARKLIREAFAKAGFDYVAAAALLGLHQYTLRKRARALGITQELVKDRERAKKRGLRPDDNGRPRKPPPAEAKIVKVFVKCGGRLADTAEALQVSHPTLRRWIREDPALQARLDAVRRRSEKK